MAPLLSILVLSAALLPADISTRLDLTVRESLARGDAPGALVWAEIKGHRFAKAWGNRSVLPEREPLTVDTLFDIASLTKIVATTPAILHLRERGELKLDQTANSILPTFHGQGKEAITIRQLLTHTSGLRAGVPKSAGARDRDAILHWIHGCEPASPPGTALLYSDVNFILLAEIVETLTGETLASYVRREIWDPLRLWDTHFLPEERLRPRIAPTERISEGTAYLRGIVHDPTSRYLGGVSGSAGVFSSASDLARFARMMLGQGALEGVRILRPETIRLMTTPQTPPSLSHKRGLGWDIDTPLSRRPRGEGFAVPESYGHTGYTGTSLWIDPTRSTFVLLLTSRTHPTLGDVRALRSKVATL
ncbi:MAG: serine hydrolase domain-containing protein, partial [Verrucomicrobiota bacterium]